MAEDTHTPIHIYIPLSLSPLQGFKIEWMAVKDNHLWVGGIGKDWTTAEGEALRGHHSIL